MTEWTLLVEFVRSTKSTLDALKRLTKLSQKRFSDKRFGEVFCRMMTKEMEKTENLADSLLEYVRVITPAEKAGTIHTLLEETLKGCQTRLDEKKTEVTREFEWNLPETIVPDEHMRYMLRSLLGYAVNVMPSYGFLRFSTRSSVSGATKEQMGFTVVGRAIEITTAFSAVMKRKEEPPAGLEMISNNEREILKFQIWLLENVVKRNQGNLTFAVDKEKDEITIFVKFPIERRRVVCYQ